MAKLIENVKVVKAEAKPLEFQERKTKTSIVKIQGLDYLLVECPECKITIGIPMVTIRLLKYKRKHQKPAGVV